jgi:hypothetical protein
MGQVAHSLPVIAAPRLLGSNKLIPEMLESLQVALNDVTRSVNRCKREDHVAVKTLLDSARYLSVNQLVVKSTSMVAWSAFVSSDGKDGTRNPGGRLLFDSNHIDTAARPTRATAAGAIRVQTRCLTGAGHEREVRGEQEVREVHSGV